MGRRNNQRKKNKKKGQGNEERNNFLKSAWQCLLGVLACLLSAVMTSVHIISWIPWVPAQLSAQLFFLLAWISLVCLNLGLNLLGRVVIVPWTVWFCMLLEGVDFGCSIIRLIILALPFVLSKQVMRSLQLMVNSMWPSWMHRLLPDNWFSIGQLPILVDHNVDNGQHGFAANRISVGEYVDQHPATMPHPTYQFQIPTREGLNLWQGFINIVLNAYEGNQSWAGSFSEEHLRMSGSQCIIEMNPSYPANFPNLLLDLAQLAALLIAYFETPNLLAPKCIQTVYSAMTAPKLGPIPAPSAEQLVNFLKYMRNQPGLKPARKSGTFLTKVFQARRGMGVIRRAILDAAIQKVLLPDDWMDNITGLGYRILSRTVLYREHNPSNLVAVYQSGAEEFFRFLRNVLEHGGDLDANGRQMLSDMEDLDYIIAEEFSDKINELVWHLVMDVDMTERLNHAWADYQ